MKRYSILALLLCFALLASCGGNAPAQESGEALREEESAPVATESGSVSGEVVPTDPSELFSDRDRAGTYEERESVRVSLDGATASCSSGAVSIDGGTVTITREGTYLLSGTLSDGMIIVDADKSEKVQLVLDGAAIHSETSAAIYVRQADKVFLTLAEGSSNSLSNGGTFTAIDENNIDSVIFSKDDLTMNGSGSLTITSPSGHGVVSKDELTITGGSYDITSASHGLCGKDSVCVSGGVFLIAAGKHGIQADNDEDTALGFIYVEGGSFTISAEGDGLSASSYLQIEDGTFDIVSGGGSVNAAQQTSENWGGFGGGMGGGNRGGHGGMGGGSAGTGSQEDTDSTSIKGLKASTLLVINGGSFTIDSADDAFHSNGDLTVNGGTFDIATGDDGFHADETLSITAGAINITKSYEGLEGLHVLVSGGEVSLVSSDDGLNAAGGADSSGMGGFRGGDVFGGMSGSSNGSIVISGGSLYVQASGDGLDANGTLTISGGYTVVCGPTQGDTATLDYDTSAVISGGTFIGTGASGMAQTFSSSEGQGVFAVSVGGASAGTSIVLTDSSGNVVIDYTPELSFAVVILSSPDIVKGETYTITVGTVSGSFEAS